MDTHGNNHQNAQVIVVETSAEVINLFQEGHILFKQGHWFEALDIFTRIRHMDANFFPAYEFFYKTLTLLN